MTARPDAVPEPHTPAELPTLDAVMLSHLHGRGQTIPLSAAA